MPVFLAIGCGDSHFEKGKIYLKEGRLARAEQEFKAAIAKNPQEAEANIGLGQVYIAQKEYDKALEHLQKALEYDATSVRVHNQIAKVYLTQEQLELAIQTCEKVLAINPKASTYSLLGLAYFQKKEISKAAEAFKNAIQNEPDNAEAHIRLIDLYVWKGQVDLGEQQYRTFLATHPKNKEAHFKLAELYHRQSQPEKAEAEYRAIQEIDPRDLDSLLALGRLYSAGRKHTQAITTYDSALELARRRRHKIQIYRHLIRLYNQENQFSKAIEMCHKLASQLPRDAPDNPKMARRILAIREFLYLNQGIAYLGQANYSNAALALQRLVSINPKEALYQYRLGVAYTGSKNYRRAIDAYKKTLKLKPTFTDARLNLANAYIAIGEPEIVVQECEQVLTASVPNTEQKAEAHYLSGVAYMALGDYKKSLNQLQEALKLHPDSAEIYMTIGNLYSRQKQFEDAIRYYQMAIEHNPELASAYQGLADVYALIGNTSKAVDAYNKAIALNPNSAGAHNSLAWYYARQGTNLDRALELADKAVALEPKSAAFRDTLGWIYYKKGMLQKAITELMMASLYDRDNPQIDYHLGLAYYHDGNIDRAYHKLKAAINANTTFSEIDEAKKILQEIEAQ